MACPSSINFCSNFWKLICNEKYYIRNVRQVIINFKMSFLTFRSLQIDFHLKSNIINNFKYDPKNRSSSIWNTIHLGIVIYITLLMPSIGGFGVTQSVDIRCAWIHPYAYLWCVNDDAEGRMWGGFPYT